MGIKVQYSPSTGKASWNPLTGLVQGFDSTGEPCTFCGGNTPKFIRATFSGIDFPTECCPSGVSSCLATNVIDPNKSYVLEQITTGNNCEWLLDTIGSTLMTLNTYISNPCTDPPVSSVNLTRLRVRIRKTATNVLIMTLLYGDTDLSPACQWFSFGGTLSPDSDCLNYTDVDNDQVSENCFTFSQCLSLIGFEGTCIIEEL